MTTFEIVNWIHLVAAGVWTGGLIVLGFLVAAVRRHTDDRELLRVMARRFSVVSWTAFVVALISGVWMYTEYGLPWSRFELKGTLIVVAGGLALIHQFTAKRTPPAVRGIIQLSIMVASIGIFGAAVALI
ncbi:MAG TPA: hypothetical protein VLA29_04265 [Acidimicrobiia bacterium]|nr:hypothetical protein [Acidimicrobiia bacterium]